MKVRERGKKQAEQHGRDIGGRKKTLRTEWKKIRPPGGKVGDSKDFVKKANDANQVMRCAKGVSRRKSANREITRKRALSSSVSPSMTSGSSKRKDQERQRQTRMTHH